MDKIAFQMNAHAGNYGNDDPGKRFVVVGETPIE